MSVTRIQPRENRSYQLGRHATSPEQLHVNKVATEKNEVGVEGSRFSDDALEARNIVGMGAGMKIGKKEYSERMRPPRPTIDYEPQSANQTRTRLVLTAVAALRDALPNKAWSPFARPRPFPPFFCSERRLVSSSTEAARSSDT